VEGEEAGAESKTPEAILAEAAETGTAEEVDDVSAEEIADAEDEVSDAVSEADAREEQIETENDAVDSLVNESQETSGEGIDDEGQDRG
jgi:N utilization substance protein A